MESEKSDMEIIDEIRQGSVSAFEQLYKRYSDLIYRNILVRVKSSFDADDIFQSFFMILWEKRASIHVTGTVKGYLLVWLRNHILNTIKEEQIRIKYQELSHREWDESDDYTWVNIVATDLNDKIKAIVDTFPPRLRSIYILSREQNLSVKEIAEKLSISEQTVKNQLSECLRRLRIEISKKNFFVVV